MVATHNFTVFRGDNTGKIQRGTTEKRLEADEVLIRVTHSGLCGTDCHFRSSGIVLGHEGIGTVEACGENAKKYTKGDVVGWGYIHETCGSCHNCLSGREVYCATPKIFGNHAVDQGSLSTQAIWKEAYIFAIPSALNPANAAPLMCAGATVFSPLYEHGVNGTHTVGIVGIGGLGHLAIQFAAKMGCRVVVFSSTEDKRDEAMKLGANEFYATKGKTHLDVEHPLDFLLVTTSFIPSWKMYFDTMAKGGTVVALTVAQGDITIPYENILQKGLKLMGSSVASRWVHKLMLEFAARHNIQAQIEEFPMTEEGITEAFDKLDAGKLRYRAVLKNEM
ncbi:putative NADP-dependent alcohol dehydrogenase C 2 [Tricharina praecox]|uniref:putative NADP-dependent alcohol dehydrogenase C 2 n=1 Tax=Tricharina praecox TaxID=43433 RepID=UPI0022202AB6|nr:putative NADP-dependent alcohol dehydrogenase C 2 [Tricharina praecox]KAI5857833.1 putative NADP-dependent alcohol dehydrogenase C 2 [Tricharina praecox]